MTDELSLEDLVRWAEEHTRFLYDGVEVPHRSCGIALAETYGLRTAPYQALRRGGITGCGECGAIKAGELILGELLGDPSPTGAVTANLRSAMIRYRELWQKHVDLGISETIICNDLTAPFGEFHSPERHQFCTRLAASASKCVAITLTEHGIPILIKPQPQT